MWFGSSAGWTAAPGRPWSTDESVADLQLLRRPVDGAGGHEIQYRAILREPDGTRVVSAVRTVTRTAPEPLVHSVTVAGSLQSEMGCPADWDPACAASHLTFDTNDGLWKGTVRFRRVTTSTRSPSTTAGTSTTAPAERRADPTSPSADPGLDQVQPVHLHLGSGDALVTHTSTTIERSASRCIDPR